MTGCREQTEIRLCWCGNQTSARGAAPNVARCHCGAPGSPHSPFSGQPAPFSEWAWLCDINPFLSAPMAAPSHVPHLCGPPGGTQQATGCPRMHGPLQRALMQISNSNPTRTLTLNFQSSKINFPTGVHIAYFIFFKFSESFLIFLITPFPICLI